jgi:hypothetical protein
MMAIVGLLTSEQLTGAVGTAGIIGAAFAVVRSKRIEKTLDLLGQGNDELRKLVNDEKEAREADQRACDLKLAEMSGQVKVLTTSFGRDVARAIAEEWRDIQARTPIDAVADRRRQHKENPS